ncbi:MAG: hypothetical protein MJZ34_05490 [Paludibacteraceae bacterium]|nr:hypothetical protein [Paludibacteraceae bacterium]
MLFKDLKIGDTIYVKNPKQWDKPIKKTIGNILPDAIWLKFYTTEGEFIGEGIANRTVGYGSGIFADFKSFKEYWINYQNKNINQLKAEVKKYYDALENACQDLATASLMEDED